MSGKVNQTHLKCFFFSLLLFLPPKLQKYANFWEKCRFPVFLPFCSKMKPSLFFFSSNMKFPVSFGSQTISNAIPWKKIFFQDFCLNSVLRPPFSFSWPIERRCLVFYVKHAGSLKKNSPEDSAIHRAYVEDKRDKYIDAGVVFLAYILRI